MIYLFNETDQMSEDYLFMLHKDYLFMLHKDYLFMLHKIIYLCSMRSICNEKCQRTINF